MTKKAFDQGGWAKKGYIWKTPEKPTQLYRHYDENGVLLYVGISLSALRRLGQHSSKSHWFHRIVNVKVTHYKSTSAAYRAETKAIRTENPLYNKQGKPTNPLTNIDIPLWSKD